MTLREQFLEIADLLPEAAMLVSADGTILAISRACTSTRLGLEPEKLRGANLTDFTEGSEAQLLEYLRLCSRSRDITIGAMTLKGRNGQPASFRCEGAVLRPRSPEQEAWVFLRLFPKSSSVSRFLALNQRLEELATEVHKRQRAERAQRKQAEMLRITLESIGDGVITVDTEGKVTFQNLAGEKLTGWAGDAAVGQPITKVFRLIDGETRRPAPNPVETVLERGTATGLTSHAVILAKDGSECAIDDSAAPIRDPQGNVIGVVLIFRDVSERERSERRLRAIIEQTPVSLVVVDEAGQIAMANSRAEASFGYEPGELLGQSVEVLMPERLGAVHAAQRVQYWKDRSARTMGTGLDLSGRRKDGTEFPVEVGLNPIQYDDRPMVLSAILDVSERRAFEAHLRQHQKLEAIGTLAGGVAHEINNPVSGIINYAKLIDERLDPQSPLREYAVEIGREGERVSEIVRSLLSFARQDKQSHGPVRIADIVNDTVSLIRTIIRRDQILLELDVPEDLPELRCRSQQIQQVLMNLLTNARDALNARYPAHDPDKIMTLTVRTFDREGQPWLRTTVEDHGEGIPEQIRRRIFDPFFTTKDRSEGTGLGLSISHGIAREHHGELSVECEAGRFTRFYLDLPLNSDRSLGPITGNSDREGAG